MSEELLKTIEELKWKIGSELVDLREENEQLRVQFDELKQLSMKLADTYYDDEEKHYEETGAKDHIFHTITKIIKLNKLNQ